ncbi:MAG: ribulokinase [Sedimentisphaerales bacterium]|nr:ribulokinase [Sedimentisphaerales bacterium]
MSYTIGLDYGSNSVRCIVVNVADGTELATEVFNYPTGDMGIMLDGSDHNVARQNPQDYIDGLEATVKNTIAAAKKADSNFDASQIIGIGVDTTGSTPIPVDEQGRPLGLQDAFKDNLNAMSWLWKDHTGYAEAAEITELAQKYRPQYLAKCGGTYSSEWFFSKILHCLRVDSAVFDAAYTWVEHADYMTGLLTGTSDPRIIKRCRCAAGHKAMFSDTWGGYPDKEFLSMLDPKLGELRDTLSDQTYAIDTAAGDLTSKWASKLGLPGGIPVAMGAIDAHLGAVGAGIGSGTVVQILGTSSCDMVVSPNTDDLPDVPGICGIVDGSVLPGFFALEAGQSAVGDIFNWFVNYIQPGGSKNGSHTALTERAAQLKPGESGLLALDWNNGNRTVLADQRLTGLLLGQTLHTKPEEIYRSLIEATAFGALTIINRFEEYGINIEAVINCGGIAEKNSVLMQIYADVTGREMKVSRSAQTCALGSAIAAAVVAGKANGGYGSFQEAQNAMTGVKDITYKPIPENHKVYAELYGLYKQVHDAFGTDSYSGKLNHIMKDLLAIKERCKG